MPVLTENRAATDRPRPTVIHWRRCRPLGSQS